MVRIGANGSIHAHSREDRYYPAPACAALKRRAWVSVLFPFQKKPENHVCKILNFKMSITNLILKFGEGQTKHLSSLSLARHVTYHLRFLV